MLLPRLLQRNKLLKKQLNKQRRMLKKPLLLSLKNRKLKLLLPK